MLLSAELHHAALLYETDGESERKKKSKLWTQAVLEFIDSYALKGAWVGDANTQSLNTVALHR